MGRGVGAATGPGVRRAGVISLALGLGYATAAAIGLWLAGDFIAGLFLDPAEPENWPVIEIAVRLLLIAAWFQLFDAAQTIALGALRGLRDTAVPMAYAIAGYWGLGFTGAVVLGYWVEIAPGWGGVYGVWLGFVIGLASVAVALTLRFLARSRI